MDSLWYEYRDPKNVSNASQQGHQCHLQNRLMGWRYDFDTVLDLTGGAEQVDSYYFNKDGGISDN